MRALIWPTDPSTGISIAHDLRSRGIPATATNPSLGDLIRDEDAIGVYMTVSPISALTFLREARQARGVRNCLMVLLATMGEPGKLATQRVSVLAAGADDAQQWPIDPRELVARIQALKARTRAPSEAPVSLPGGFYYRGNGTVVGETCTISLTKQEQGIFDALVDRSGSLVTKGQLMAALYHGLHEPQEKIVDVFVCKLRKKLAPVSGDLEVVETVWGQGYRFVPHGFRPARVAAFKRMAVRS